MFAYTNYDGPSSQTAVRKVIDRPPRDNDSMSCCSVGILVRGLPGIAAKWTGLLLDFFLKSTVRRFGFPLQCWYGSIHRGASLPRCVLLTGFLKVIEGSHRLGFAQKAIRITSTCSRCKISFKHLARTLKICDVCEKVPPV